MASGSSDRNATLTIGRYRLDPIAEFEGPRMQPAAMFSKTDPTHLAELLKRVPEESYDPQTNHLLTSVHSWLVRDDAGMVMLVDTCFGNFKNRMPTHPAFHMQETDWLGRLAALGVQPDDVNIVVNTHLHLDHVGWNTKLVDGVWTPVFNNARHLMPQIEVENQQAIDTPTKAFVDSVAPVIEAGLADPVGPGHMIAPDIRLIPCYGHSQGMLLVEVSGGETGIILAGDPLHHPLQLLDPNVNTGYCENQEKSAASRWELLERCAEDGWMLAATHFYGPRVMKIRRSGDAFDVAE